MVESYDLFLSHNSKQKPWVRELVRFLRGLGLTVFFDEDCIKSGQDTALAIERAIEASNTLVLVISRSALRSRWVSFEAALRIYDDPLGETRVLVPILVEPVDWSQVRGAVRRLDRVDLTDPDTREAEFLHFLRSIGVPNEKCCPIQTWPEPVGIDDLYVADVNSVISAGWSGEQLLEKLISLDYEMFEDLEQAHEGVPKQWAPVFMSHPETWRLLTTEAREIAGYWHFVPLFREEFEQATRGELIDSEITADKLRLFELPGWYDIYFVSMGLQPRYRRPKAVAKLFRSLLDVACELAKSGIFVREVCANAYTASGVGLCKSFSMNHVGNHRERGKIFTATFRELLEALPLEGKESLIALYSSCSPVPAQA